VLFRSDAVPSYRLLELEHSIVTGWYYPRFQACTVAGVLIAAEYTQAPIDDYLKVSIFGGDTGDVADIWVMLN